MIVAAKTFLINLLCALVPCDPDFGSPEIINGYRSKINRLHGDPVVMTNSGIVEGHYMESSNGRIIYAFEGIPYAEPPINQFRFRPAIRKKPWNSKLFVKHVGPYCLQMHPAKLFRVIGQEDCLYLNIYSPIMARPKNSAYDARTINSTKQLLPVITWIHGGGFTFGSGGEYGPAYLLNEDVLLITMNYRLGILGFLSTGDNVSPGNYGLKDQLLAIQWIHENVQYFGGDPDKITLMGQSAGAVSVHLHMLNEREIKEGWFRSGVSLSGTAFVHWAVQTPEEGRQWTIKVAKIIGCPQHNNTEMINCFKQQNPVFLVASQLNLLDWLPFPPILFAPVIEPESSGAFLTQSPDVLYDQNKISPISWITSITTEEGWTALLFTEGLLRTDMIKKHWYDLAPILLNYQNKGNRKTSERISRFYFGVKGPTSATLSQLGDVASDRYFTFGFHKGIQRHCQVAPTFAYVFGYNGIHNIANSIGYQSSQWGVGHGEDLFYYFNSSSSYPGFKKNDRERGLSNIMINMLVNFATKGKPTYKDHNGNQVDVWSNVNNATDIKALQINLEIKMISEPFKKRIRFWQSVGLADTKSFIPI